MKQDTADLIRRLAKESPPVQPLSRPLVRTILWLALSATAIAIVGFLVPIDGLPSKASEPMFLLEQAAGLFAGIGAAAAAFASVVPGYSRRLVGLLLLPLAGWLGSLGPGCFSEIMQFGFGGLPFEHNLSCFPLITLLAIVPALVMAVMLRRGAPITPHLSVALGAFASAGLANFSLRVLYPEDVTIMLVVWHVGGVFILTAAASLAAGALLNWRRIRVVSKTS